MKALTFQRYGKSPEIGITELPRPRYSPTSCWSKYMQPD
jgi:hypothetical protein